MTSKNNYQCNICSHEAVCRYKSNFLQIQQMINDDCVYVGESDDATISIKYLPNVESVDLRCRYYDSPIATMSYSKLNCV